MLRTAELRPRPNASELREPWQVGPTTASPTRRPTAAAPLAPRPAGEEYEPDGARRTELKHTARGGASRAGPSAVDWLQAGVQFSPSIGQDLVLSHPADRHEREADQIAKTAGGCSCGGGCGCGGGGHRARPSTIQRKAAPGHLASPGGQPRAAPMKPLLPAAGRPMEQRDRADFEARLGRDLSDVRMHTDDQAAQMAAEFGAEAFTLGSDIGFAAGRYAPGSVPGQQLISHELVHVLQQSGHLGPPVQGVVQRQQTSGGTVPATAPAGTATVPAGTTTSPAGTTTAPSAEAPAAEFAVVAPAPGPPQEDAPIAPRPGLDRVWFRGVLLVNDRDFIRGELRRLIARNGIEGADEWHMMLHGWRPTTVGLPFSAHARGYGGLRVRSSFEAQREMQYEQQFRRVLPVVQPLVDEVYAEVRADALAFLTQFQDRAKEITRSVLRDSEARIEAERIRYGLEREETVRVRYVASGEGPRVPEYDVTVRHEMERNVSTLGLAGAAADLKAKRDEIAALALRRSRLIRVRGYYPGAGVPITELPEENRPEHERLGKLIEDKNREYDILRASYEDKYPILVSYANDPAAIARIARGPSPATAAVLNEVIHERLGNIQKVRTELNPGGRVKVWKLPEIVALTKAATGAVPDTSLGAMRSRVVDDKVRQVIDEEFWRNLALGALAIGLALLAAIPTGGGSLVAGVAAVAALGSLGLSVYTVSQHVQEYQLARAMTGTDFDRARAISAEDPSLFWLAVDILGAALDVGPGLRGTRLLLTAGQRTFSKVAPAVRRALTASGDASQEIANLRRLAEAAEHGGPGLAARVVANVDHLRSARGSVQRIVGVAGHEAEAVQKATAALTREAEQAIASAPTRLGDHAVSITPSGRIVRCTNCGILREEYALELGRNDELARRWFEIDDLAKEAARTKDAAKANQAAAQARELADELEAFRRTREVRVYRGLRSGAIDNAFLMDRRLVVDMPFVGRGALNTNAEGWLRDAQYYWREMVRRHPDAFSPDNLRRIRGDPPLAGPVAPVNDAQFRAVFPQYDVRGLRAQPLIHHHVAGGGQAAAIPAPLHPGSGGIHNVERAAGIWGAENPIADVLQRLLQQAEAAAP